MYAQLLNSLRLVSDPRRDRRKVYPLDYILLIIFASTMSGCRSWYEIEDYAEDWEDSIKAIYRSLSGDTTDYELPAHDTLNRVVSLLDPEYFEKAYRTWLMSFLPIGDEKHLCLDGKTMRGVKKLDFEHSAHVVSAYNPAEMASVAQVYLDSKSNEINGIKLLLEQLDLSDTLVSIDAIGTQTEIADQIKRKGGDYVLCVKNNQKHSLQEIESLFAPIFQQHIERYEHTELSHGRIETRVYELIAEPLSLESNPILERWAGLKSVLRVSRKREDKKTSKVSEETVYYISSIADLERLRQAIRSHWAIENNLHHCLDVYLGQDTSHKRLGNVPQIMDVILKINLFILMHLREKTGLSIPRLQKKLSRNTPEQITALSF